MDDGDWAEDLFGPDYQFLRKPQKSPPFVRLGWCLWHTSWVKGVMLAKSPMNTPLNERVVLVALSNSTKKMKKLVAALR